VSGNIAPVAATVARAQTPGAPAPGAARRERAHAGARPTAALSERSDDGASASPAAFRDTLRAQVAQVQSGIGTAERTRVGAKGDDANDASETDSSSSAPAGSTTSMTAGQNSLDSDALWQRLSAGLSMGVTAQKSGKTGSADGRAKVSTARFRDAASGAAASSDSGAASPSAGQPALNAGDMNHGARPLLSSGGVPTADVVSLSDGTSMVDGISLSGSASTDGVDAGTSDFPAGSLAQESGGATGPAGGGTSSSAALQAPSADGSTASRNTLAVAPLLVAAESQSNILPASASVGPAVAWSGSVAAGSASAGASAGSAAVAVASSGVASRSSLVQTLGDRLQVQIARGSESAVIRLDPASMGSIEISIRHEGGGIQVHLSASNSDVVAQLHAIGDSLRQDLNQRHQGDVSVQVSGGTRDAPGRQRSSSHDEEDPGRALQDEANGDRSPSFALARKGAQA
jgi:flagellar hook-length control protein FliK